MRHLKSCSLALATGLGAAMLLAAPAKAQPASCITDAELNAAVGDQISSGAFAINTSALREAPMCSGVTVVRAIQQLGERLRGTDADGPDAAPARGSAQPTAALAAASSVSSSSPAPVLALTAPKRAYPFSVSFKDPTSAQNRIARASLADMFGEYAEYADERPVTYFVGMADLNDDGLDDMIIHVRDQQSCGQWGCQGYGILATPTGFANKGVQLGTCFNYSITVMPTKNGGMRDLRFDDFKQKTVWAGRYYDGGCVDP